MKTTIRVTYWLPRFICILAILFISLFALDAFSPNLTIWQQIGGFIIHLVPSFILTAFLIVAWKWEYFGGVAFTILGVITSPLVFMVNYQRNHFTIPTCLFICLIITFPFIVVGVLFIMSHFKSKRNIM